MTKDDILNCDLLIIHRELSTWQVSNKAMALKELVNIRKTMNKITWLYMEQTNLQEFEEYYPKVTNAFGKSYRSEF